MTSGQATKFCFRKTHKLLFHGSNLILCPATESIIHAGRYLTVQDSITFANNAT